MDAARITQGQKIIQSDAGTATTSTPKVIPGSSNDFTPIAEAEGARIGS